MNRFKQNQLSSLNLKHKPKPKNLGVFTIASFFRGLWRLRYRFYAIIVLIALLPLLYASNLNIPNNIDIIGQKSTSSNFLYTVVNSNNSDFPFLVETLGDKFSSYFLKNENNNQDISEILARFQISANEQIELNKLAPLEQLVPAPKNPQQKTF